MSHESRTQNRKRKENCTVINAFLHAIATSFGPLQSSSCSVAADPHAITTSVINCCMETMVLHHCAPWPCMIEPLLHPRWSRLSLDIGRRVFHAGNVTCLSSRRSWKPRYWSQSSICLLAIRFENLQGRCLCFFHSWWSSTSTCCSFSNANWTNHYADPNIFGESCWEIHGLGRTLVDNNECLTLIYRKHMCSARTIYQKCTGKVQNWSLQAKFKIGHCVE